MLLEELALVLGFSESYEESHKCSHILHGNSTFRNFAMGIIIIVDKIVFFKTFMPALLILTNFQQVKYPTTEELLLNDDTSN